MPTASSPSRRDVLRGAGVALALPFLESLGRAAAAAAGKPPVRLGIFTVTGGTVLESWRPQNEGPLAKLPSILRPLEAFKDDILVVSGLSQNGRAENLTAHEHCAFTHLTGAAEVKRVGNKVYAGVSVDQAAARAVGDRTLLPSLEIGLNSNQTYSFSAADQPLPTEGNPRLIFDRMFRGRRSATKSDSDEQSVLDVVLEDAKSLQNKLASADRRRLDEYLHSVRAVERRVAAAEARQRQEVLDAPPKSTPPAGLPPEGTPLWKITRPIDTDPERHAEYIRLLSDLMVLAFQTDTTRVVTLSAGSDECLFPGVVTVGYERHCHTLEHQGNAGRVADADPIAREACRQIHAWYTALFAEVVRKMKAIVEGGSTLLDNCFLLYTSYMADGGHGRDDYPVLLAGRAGGTLRPGRHVAVRKRTPVANLYAEVLVRTGAKADSFGNTHTDENRAYDGRLPGLV